MAITRADVESGRVDDGTLSLKHILHSHGFRRNVRIDLQWIHAVAGRPHVFQEPAIMNKYSANYLSILSLAIS